MSHRRGRLRPWRASEQAVHSRKQSPSVLQDPGRDCGHWPWWLPEQATRSTRRSTIASIRQERSRMSTMRCRHRSVLALLLVISLLRRRRADADRHGRRQGHRPAGRRAAGRQRDADRARGDRRRRSPTRGGMFRFVGVHPATYRLKAELAGFLTRRSTQVVVGIGKTVDRGIHAEGRRRDGDRRGQSGGLDRRREELRDRYEPVSSNC